MPRFLPKAHWRSLIARCHFFFVKKKRKRRKARLKKNSGWPKFSRFIRVANCYLELHLWLVCGVDGQNSITQINQRFSSTDCGSFVWNAFFFSFWISLFIAVYCSFFYIRQWWKWEERKRRVELALIALCIMCIVKDFSHWHIDTNANARMCTLHWTVPRLPEPQSHTLNEARRKAESV